ncbi:hypothetical protein HaLaN_21575 [Haematococcus lacustris]|uniref:Uncharacterized protein n=1 Tax=Haematococcus lacustris TaxID=44745 RepID=A0A699ZMJ1_HAELA|nr:hypothetical protein HaLaN_21575 [Haematococcus lacustris]
MMASYRFHQVLPSLQPLVLGLEQRSTLLRQAMRSARHGGAQGVMAVQQLTTWLHASVPGLELQQLRYFAVLLLHMSEGPVGSASLQDINTLLKAGGGWVGSLDLTAALQRAVPLTRHTWRVTVCGALGLPDEAQLGAAGLPVPSSRYAKYYYPATHCLLLPAGVSPTPELLSLQTSDAQLLAPQLVFEVRTRSALVMPF